MKQLLSISFLLFFFNFPVQAQPETIILKGTVIDQETNEGIAFISIGIEDTYLGTATNPDGLFELKVPMELRSKKLFFSAIGYKNLSMLISDFEQKKNIVIPLIPQSYSIENIDIAAESMVLQRILRTASEQIPKHYISGPINLKMYYEERISIEGAASKIKKNIVDIYDRNGYANPSWIDAFKSRKYKISETQPAIAEAQFSDQTIDLDEILEMDIARLSNTVLNPKLLNDYKMIMESKTIFNGDSVWIISYSTNKMDLAHTGSFYPTSYKGKIYISATDYEVLRNEINLTALKANTQGRSLAVNIKPETKIQMNIQTDYKKVKGKCVLAYINAEKHYISAEKQSVYQSGKAVILEIKTDDLRKIESRNYVVDTKPNDSFWQNFVVPIN